MSSTFVNRQIGKIGAAGRFLLSNSVIKNSVKIGESGNPIGNLPIVLC